MLPELGWKMGGEDQRLGRKFFRVRDGRGREKRCEVR
jgi:hypothetical protein